MLRMLTKRERAISYVTVGIFIFSIAFNLLIAPILTKNENLNKEINITRIKLKKNMQLLNEREYLRKKYNELSTHLKISDVDAEISANPLSELENLAKASNIRIIDIRPTTSKTPGLYKETVIDLRTEGTMEDYLKFIYNIENAFSILRIKRLQLNAKPNTSTLEGDFSISQISTLE